MANPAQWYVNDAFTLEDGFGTLVAGDHLARMTLEATPPFTIAVAGKWGAGKTSVQRRAFATLGGQPVQLALPLGETRKDESGGKWKSWAYDSEARPSALSWGKRAGDLGERARASLAVWYSPWQHQGAPNPLIPLLLEVRAQYEARLTSLEKAKKKLPEALRRGGLAGLALLEKVADAAVSLQVGKPVRLADGTTEAVRKAWQEGREKETDLADGQRFHLLFEDALEVLLSSLVEENPGDGPLKLSTLNRVDPRLIVFIDDLDRCEESVIVQLLESIKLYLGSRRCVFVLGIDDRAVLQALERHWKRPDDENREYLEKLVQAIVPVPIPRPATVKSFVARQLETHGFPPHVRTECSHMICNLLEPNPRKVKNFVNSVCAAWQLFHTSLEGGEEKECLETVQRFLLFQYLRAYHRPVWRLLERQPRMLRVLTKVLADAPQVELENSFKGEPIDPLEQRMLEEYFVSAFSHVLKEPDPDNKKAHHRHLTLDKAVELFQHRIDRKRSDECFLGYYRDLIQLPRVLEDIYLYLPEPEVPRG